MAQTVEKRMAFYFDENGRNQLKWTETSARGWSWFRPFSAQTAFGPIVFGPFEYLAETVKIHYSAQNDSAQRSTTVQKVLTRRTIMMKKDRPKGPIRLKVTGPKGNYVQKGLARRALVFF
jgi:hypothetical protein